MMTAPKAMMEQIGVNHHSQGSGSLAPSAAKAGVAANKKDNSVNNSGVKRGIGSLLKSKQYFNAIGRRIFNGGDFIRKSWLESGQENGLTILPGQYEDGFIDCRPDLFPAYQPRILDELSLIVKPV
jgi:hypothetical protein